MYVVHVAQHTFETPSSNVMSFAHAGTTRSRDVEVRTLFSAPPAGVTLAAAGALVHNARTPLASAQRGWTVVGVESKDKKVEPQ